MAFLQIDETDNSLMVCDSFDQRSILPDLGGCWDSVNKVWKIVFTIANLEALLDAIPGLSVSSDLESKVREQISKEEKLEKIRIMSKQDVKVNFRIPGLKLQLYNYQRLGVMYAATNGVGLLLADEMGLGKFCPFETPVLTDTGWRPIGSLVIGDKVYSNDGKLHSVTGVFPQGKKEVARMRFSDGVMADSGWEHLWLVQSNNDAVRGKGWKVMDTRAISEDLTFGIKKPVSKWRIPLVSPIQWPSAKLVIPPYILGVLIGDGGLTKSGIRFCPGDDEVPQEVSAVLSNSYSLNRNKDNGTSTTFSITFNGCHIGSPMSKEITDLGLRVSGEHKFIPDKYKYADVQQRIDLLAGLLDTDGTVNGARTRFSTSSERLANDVVDLVRSLGGIAVKSIVNGRLRTRNGKQCQELDSFQITIRTSFNPFRAHTNKSKWKVSSKLVRTIVSIEYLKTCEAVCISVDSPDSTYLINDYIVTHNTLQGIGTALFMKEHSKAKNVLVITPASLKFNWPLEIEKFTDESYVVIDGTPEERISQWMRKDAFFYIVNFELLQADLFGGKKFKEKTNETEEEKQKRLLRTSNAKKRQRILSEIKNRVWDVIILDECHSIKNHSSARTQNVKELKAKCRIAMTGTPMDGRLEELHSIMQFVAPGLLMSKTRFFQKYVETDFWGRVTGYKRIGEVTNKIQPFFLRRLKKDVLKDLPDKVYENRVVSLTPEEQRVYKSLAENGHESTEDASAMVSIIRCKQFCNYPEMIDSTCKVNSKLEAFKEVLEEVVLQNGHKALIFSQYKEMLNVLVKELDTLGLKYMRIDGDTPPKDRATMQKQFNEDPKIDIMIGTEAMSTGLNFQSADYVINYDDNWSPAIMAQREDRCLTGENQVFCRRSNGLYELSRIDEVVVGDKVITHFGNEVCVSSIDSHEHRGMITEIDYTGWFDPLVCTYDHKVFVKRGDNVVWVEAHEVLPSDSMVFPRIKKWSRLESVIIKDEWRLFPKKVEECVVCGKKVTARQRCYSHYREWLEENRGKQKARTGTCGNGRYVRLPDKIVIDDSWLKLFGWYAAEGFSSIMKGKGRFVSLSGHQDERDTLTEFGKIFDGLGIKWAIYKSKKTKGIELRAYSGELALWFMSWFGHKAENKTLPRVIQDLPPEQAKVFLDKYTNGDGYYRKKQVEWVSASKTMCYQMCLLAIRSGFNPNMRRITCKDKKTNHFIGGYTISPNACNVKLAQQDDDYVYHPVRSVKTKNDKVIVYDISVDEEDHSFTTGLASVHNCHRNGQRNVVTVVNFICKNTIEERIRGVIYAKNKVSSLALGDETDELVLKRLGPKDVARLL